MIVVTWDILTSVLLVCTDLGTKARAHFGLHTQNSQRNKIPKTKMNMMILIVFAGTSARLIVVEPQKIRYKNAFTIKKCSVMRKYKFGELHSMCSLQIFLTCSLSRSRMHSTVTIDWYECFHLYEQQDTRLNHFMVPDLLIQPPIASTYSVWNKWNCFTSAPLHGLLYITLVVYIENNIWWLSVESSKRILVYEFKRPMALLIHRVSINFTMQRIFTNRGVLLP